ncbi:MAG: hypothetical protein ACE5GM_09540 [bacterium]
MQPSLSGYNPYLFALTGLTLTGYSFPLGYGLSRIIFKESEPVSRIILGFGLGIPAVVTVWSWMLWFSLPFNPSLFLAAALAVLLLLLSQKERKPGTEPLRNNYPHLALIILVAITACLFAGKQLIDLGTPAADGQLHGFLQMLLKHTGSYNPLPLYPAGGTMQNPYPPGFHVLCALSSRITGLSLPQTMLGTAVVSYLLLAVFIFETLYRITAKFPAALLGVVLIFSQGMIDLLASAQYPEIMAMIPCVGFFLIFSRMLEEDSWKNRLVSGWLLGAAGLIHTRFLFWLVSALAVYIFSRYLAKPHPSFKEQAGLISVISVALLLNIPQFTINAKHLWLTPQKTYIHPLISIKNLAKFQGGLFAVFAVFPLIFNLFKRNRLSVFLMTWISVMFVQVDYWRILNFFSPSWFYIDFQSRPFGHFKDLFSFGAPWAAAVYGLFPVVPLAGALSLHCFFSENPKYKAVAIKYKSLLTVVLLILGTGYLNRQFKTASQQVFEKLPQEDIMVLRALKKSTGFDDTFLFNPRDELSGWAPVIAERRALFFKRNLYSSADVYLVPRKEINKIFLNLERYHGFLKKNRFNYLYVPSYWSHRFGKKPGFLKPAFQVKEAKIYQVL